MEHSIASLWDDGALDLAQGVVDVFRLDTIGVTAESLCDQAFGSKTAADENAGATEGQIHAHQFCSPGDHQATDHVLNDSGSGYHLDVDDDEGPTFTSTGAAGDNPTERTCTNQRCLDYGTHVEVDHEHKPLGKQAAKPKGNRAPQDEPTQQPMRPTTQIRNSPSADQLKARKQMSRKQGSGTTNKESAMRTEAQILSEMATASLADQRTLAVELETLRHTRSASLAADREVDLADTVIRAHLTPVAVHTQHTAATDWVGDLDTDTPDPTLAMKTEATLWFSRTSAEVREDLEEFSIQAQGAATRLASRHGEKADEAFEAFIGQVDHLYRQAAKVAGDDAGKKRTIDPDKNNGNAESGLPDEVDNDDTAFDDPGFLNDDSDTGVHPKMPGAKSSAKTAVSDDDPDAGLDDEDASSGSGQCSDDDPDSGVEDDGFGGKKAPPFGSGDGGKQSSRTAANDAEESQYISERNSNRADEAASNAPTCADCGSAIEKDDPDEDPSTWHHDDGDKHDHEAKPSADSRTSAKTAADPGTEVDANTRLKDPDEEPMLAEDWEGEQPKGAADVAGTPTPGKNGYPQPKSLMLDKAAAFRATVQKNLER